jgi:hypothetical protein
MAARVHWPIVVAALVVSVLPALADRVHPADGRGEQVQSDLEPVAGFSVGWCIRARSDVFADAKRAGFETSSSRNVIILLRVNPYDGCTSSGVTSGG